MGLSTGVVKKLVADKGFGFIKGDSGELFFHKADMVTATDFDEVIEGERVEFEEVMPVPAKGRRATRVSIIG